MCAEYSESLAAGLAGLAAGGPGYGVSSLAGRQAGYTGSPAPATWAGLAASIREVLLLGLAGLGRVGTPVCGDLPPASPDTDTDLLCLRWIQVGKSK